MQKSSLSFSHSQLPVTFTSCVHSDCSPCVLFTGLSITERERTVGKVLVSSVTWSYPVALYFHGEMMSNRDMTQQTRSSPPAAPSKLEPVCTSVHCCRRTLLSLGCTVLCRAKAVIRHPEVPEVPQATKANLRVSLCFKAWSSLWSLGQTDTPVRPQHHIRYEGPDTACFSMSSLGL